MSRYEVGRGYEEGRGNQEGGGCEGRQRELFEALAELCRCFANPFRLELLDLLAQAPRTVQELAHASGNSTASTCAHLRALHLAGLVACRAEDAAARYALAGEDVLSLWLALRGVSPARLAEVERAAREYLDEEIRTIGCEQLGTAVAIARITIDELLDSARRGLGRLDPAAALEAMRSGARLIDIRSESQIAQDGTIAGALVIARNVFEWRLDPSSPYRHPDAPGVEDQVIVMCNEGYQSSLAAATLRQFGFARATDIEGGFQAWRAAGLPVVSPEQPQRAPGPR